MHRAVDAHEHCRQMSVENGPGLELLLQKLIVACQRNVRDNTSLSRVPPLRDHRGLDHEIVPSI
jgi:hypothetical protein